jgi:hypothetical protein
VRRNYLSPGRIGSTSTTSCTVSTRRWVALALLRLCRVSVRAVSPLDFSMVGRIGSRNALGHYFSQLDYSSPGCTVSTSAMLCAATTRLPGAPALLQPRRAPRLLVSRQHRLYLDYSMRRRDIIFYSHWLYFASVVRPVAWSLARLVSRTSCTWPTPCAVYSPCATARLVVWSHWLYLDYVVRCDYIVSQLHCINYSPRLVSASKLVENGFHAVCRDYSSPDRNNSTSTKLCTTTTRLPVASALPQLRRNLCHRSIGRIPSDRKLS